MADLSLYQKRREELSRRYLQTTPLQPVYTGGVDHLALISSDLEATIYFYTEARILRLSRKGPGPNRTRRRQYASRCAQGAPRPIAKYHYDAEREKHLLLTARFAGIRLGICS